MVFPHPFETYVICSSNWIMSPNFRDENKQIFETTTQELFWGKDSTKNQLPNTNKCLQLKNAQRHGDDDKSTDKAWYGCFLKWWYPQIIHVNRVFHYKPSILGLETPICSKVWHWDSEPLLVSVCINLEDLKKSLFRIKDQPHPRQANMHMML